MAVYDYLIGIGLSFGIALLFAVFTELNTDSFIIGFIIGSGFAVFGTLLPVYMIYFDIIILAVYIYFKVGR